MEKIDALFYKIQTSHNMKKNCNINIILLMFSMSVQVNPLLSLRQCFNMNFPLFSPYLWKLWKIMYGPCKSQQGNGKHNTVSITKEESGCWTSLPSRSKHLVYHDMKNTTKKTQGCWAARIWYWTRIRQDSSPKSPAVFSVARYLWHVFKRCMSGVFFW